VFENSKCKNGSFLDDKTVRIIQKKCKSLVYKSNSDTLAKCEFFRRVYIASKYFRNYDRGCGNFGMANNEKT